MSGLVFGDAVHRLGVVPVVTIDRVDDAEPLARALERGGLPIAEITFRTPAAAAVLERIAATVPEVLLGAGTVLSTHQAEAAVSAGARFVVSPGYSAEVVEWCLGHQVPVIPGVLTPTEIQTAMERGLHLLKFFPAEASGGARALAALGSVYPEVSFMPTGGIGADTLADYLALPSVAACGGTWVAPRDLIAAGEFDRIAGLARDAAATVERIRPVS